MRCTVNTHNTQVMLWWLLVGLVALLLKYHYSSAEPAQLAWMLRPLALTLEWCSGYHFYADEFGQWVSIGADVRLVKACAGINFMLMSALVYAWMLRPSVDAARNYCSRLQRYALRIAALCMAAWLTTLLANTLRILLAMQINQHIGDAQVLGLDHSTLHRWLGMGVYVPLLSLQLQLGNQIRGSTYSYRWIVFGPVLLYLGLLVAVPMITANAFQQPVLFMQHTLQIIIVTSVISGGFGLYCYCSGKLLKALRLNYSRTRKY